MGYKLTIRHGPRVERESFADLASAVDALRSRAEAVREAGRLEAVRMLRDFEPAERVAARLEISTGRPFGGRCSGLDVMGDGSMVAFSGAVMRRPIEPGEGETAFDAIRRELGG